MENVIDRLLIIQERDRKLLKYKRESRDVPRRKKSIESRLNSKRAILQTANDHLMKLTASQKEAENEVEAFKTKVNKYREQQFQIKSNEEYRALEKEIAAAQKLIAELEDRVLVIMDQVEAANKRIVEADASLQKDSTHVQGDLELLDARAVNVEKERSALQAERDGMLDGIPEDMLSRYERILNHTGDFAIVPVLNKTACGGCHMNLQPQTVNDAKKLDRLTFCSYCGRILYRKD